MADGLLTKAHANRNFAIIYKKVLERANTPIWVSASLDLYNDLQIFKAKNNCLLTESMSSPGLVQAKHLAGLFLCSAVDAVHVMVHQVFVVSFYSPLGMSACGRAWREGPPHRDLTCKAWVSR